MEVVDYTKPLADAVHDLEIWKPPEILVQLQKGEDGEPQEINLVTVIDEIPSSAERHKFMQEKGNRYYMTKNYHRNDVCYRREQIVPFFARACAKVGTEIRSKGWDDVHQKLTLKCVRGRLFSSQQSRKNQVLQHSRQSIGDNGTPLMVNPETGYKYSKGFKERKRKTVRPKKGEIVCPFEIVLKWEPQSESDSGDGRWYVFNGSMMHHGHLPKSTIFQNCLKSGPPVGDEGNLPEIGKSNVHASTGSGLKAILQPGHHWYSTLPTTCERNEENNNENCKDSEMTQLVQHEENLSQYAQEADENSDCDKVQLDTEKNNNEGHMAMQIKKPNEQDLQAHKVAISKGGAYNNMMPLFHHMTNLADADPYLYDILWQGLNQASSLMNSEAQLRQAGNTAATILSLPNVDRAGQGSRKRQRTSPTKAKNKSSS